MMHVILIATQKGGAGKSTLAAHFSALAHREGKVLLIDTDPQGSLSMWAKLKNRDALAIVRASAPSVPGILSSAQMVGVDWTIIDSPPRNDCAVSTLMQHATLTLVPVRPGVFDIHAAGATLRLAKDLKAPMACIINAAPPITRGVNEASIVAEMRGVLTAMGAPVLPGQVSQRVSLSHALIGGLSVDEYEPDGRGAAEIAAAWRSVTDIARNFPRRAQV